MNRNAFDAHLGALIQSLRTQLGLSPEDLAARVGQTRQWVRDLEVGEVRIGSAQIKALAQALDLGLSDFFEPPHKAGNFTAA